MRKLSVFNFTTLNGFYKGPNEDISWHKHGSQENEFASDKLQQENILLFGRVTYQMMAGYWPTQMAAENDPNMASQMNRAEKIVFSRTLMSADWQNSRIISDNIVEEIKKLKQEDGKDMTILGSGTIVTQFADHGLIDEYSIMIDPVALGEGTPVFKDLHKKLDLQLIGTDTFKSGVVLLRYKPV
jgi:dihydrofolate reductase